MAGPMASSFFDKLSAYASAEDEGTANKIKESILIEIEERHNSNMPSSHLLENLEALAFSGGISTQVLFTEAMLVLCSEQDPGILITTPIGRNILKRLLWCSQWDHE